MPEYLRTLDSAGLDSVGSAASHNLIGVNVLLRGELLDSYVLEPERTAVASADYVPAILGDSFRLH